VDIKAVAEEEWAIVLRLKSDEFVRISLQGRPTPYSRESGVRILADLIRRAQMELLAASSSPMTEAMLAAATADASPANRVAAIARERLLETAEDPAAELKLRVAAIHALSAGADAHERERLDVLGEASASPEVQTATKRAPGGLDPPAN
jgi:hypothetical protein